MSNPEMRHPEAELLLQYLDGELPGRQARRVRRHVEACWQCRSELDELQKTVGACVRYRREVQDLYPPPPGPWMDLTREFEREDASLEPAPLLRRPVFRWTVLAATAVSLVAATLTLRTTIFRSHQQTVANPDARLRRNPASPASTIVRTDRQGPSAGGDLPVLAGKPADISDASKELQVVAVLHQLGADLGEPVEVSRDAAGVVVSGTGVSPALRERIRGALAALPDVVVRFSEPEVAPLEPPAADTKEPAPSRTSSLPARLEAQLGGHAQFENFSSQLLEQNESAMSRAYALRRLAQQFPREAENRLKAEDRRLLRNMAREHAEALGREVAAIEGAVSSVLQLLGGSPQNAPESGHPADWQGAADELFRSAQRSETLLAALLGASTADVPANNIPSQLSAAVAQLQADVQQCERLLTQ
ncbi:MAG: hypothetical protein C5B51_29860 [Terriglobia bacterium]|nr:MAG: hypothetical protein C5B51_29860 [Terriglobia bacterium]